MMRAAQQVVSELECAVMREEIMAGLKGHPKQISPKYFYDAVGSHLFEALCHTPEYYVTRVERALLENLGPEIARLAGPGCVLIEPGSGNSEKVRLLLDAVRPAAYVPVEICGDTLARATARLGKEHPWLPVHSRHHDYERGVPDGIPQGRRVVFFPGSSIGNYEPRAAVRFMQRLWQLAGPGGGLLIGVDLKKDAAVLNAAYNDGAGITAAFNLNLLARLNRELEGEFDLRTFEHCAFFAADRSRVEMHLVSRLTQRVRVAGEVIGFAAGESIHTENSYKYTIDQFRRLAAEAGWKGLAAWADPEHLFSVQFFTRED